jgi:hypothetical protein
VPSAQGEPDKANPRLFRRGLQKGLSDDYTHQNSCSDYLFNVGNASLVIQTGSGCRRSLFQSIANPQKESIMAMSMSEIVKKSDEKRGMVAKSYKLPRALVEEIARAAESAGKPQSAIIAEAFALWQAQNKNPA